LRRRALSSEKRMHAISTFFAAVYLTGKLSEH
jgi:hypothetical protein